jgi:hypothetical protein
MKAIRDGRHPSGLLFTVCAALVLAAVPVAASPAGAAARRAAPTRPPAWRAVRLPSSLASSADLADVSASGPADAWVVGGDAITADEDRPLILHWNGRSWSEVALRGVPGPGDLSSVSAWSRSDAWALGTDRYGTVLLHWNGRRWRSVNFPGRADADWYTVAAGPDGVAWLSGSRQDAQGTGPIVVERWNGRAWQVVPTGLGRGALGMVRVSASGDVWAAGFIGNDQPLIAHEHRGVWTSLLEPDSITLTDVLAVSPHDVWAVGGNITVTPITASAEIAHWNGRRWTRTHLPSSGLGFMVESISPGRSGRPQWAGLLDLSGPARTRYGYYNGTAWSMVAGATVLPGNVFDVDATTAHIPGTDATWAVGSYAILVSGNVTGGRSFIEFNPG